MNPFGMEAVVFDAVSPILSLAIFALLMLATDLFFDLGRGRENSTGSGVLSAIFCILAWLLSFRSYWGITTSHSALGNLLSVDHYSWVFFTFILCGGALAFLLGEGQLERQRVRASVDVNVLSLFAICGALVMVSAANLIVLFLGFELLSVCVYVLTGLARDERASAEGALKYFILGAFSSAFLLYGMVLVYAATGTMEISALAAQLGNSNPLILVGLGLIIFGFAFKVSLVPFHFWTPDVYHGAPTSLAGFMAVVVKASAFGSFLRLMHVSFGPLAAEWSGVLWTLSVLSMTLGNFVAIRQRSIKRMLAYSSIAHAGYITIGFLVFRSTGAEAVIFYILAYSLMTIVSFGAVVLVTAGTALQYADDDFDSLRGVGWRSPFIGICMSIAMLSLAGMPPFAGFVAKLYLFTAAIHEGYLGLVIIAALNSVVSLYYYLRVLVMMYFTEPATTKTGFDTPALPIAFGPRIAIGVAVIGTVYFGIFSQSFFETARLAIRSLG